MYFLMLDILFFFQQKNYEVSELKTENYVCEKTEAMTTSTENTGTVQDKCSNSEVFFYSNSKRTGNWAQRGYHRGTCGKVHSSYCSSSVKRGQSRMVSRNSSRSAYSRSSDKVVTEYLPKYKQGHRSSSECDNVVDQQCVSSCKAVNVGNASQGCTVGSRKKDVEITLDGVEGVKASESADIRRDQGFVLAESNALSGRRFNAVARPRISVVQLLKEYSEGRQQTEFNRNVFTCKICFQVTSLVLTYVCGFQTHCVMLYVLVFVGCSFYSKASFIPAVGLQPM
jgi:hypothetical protein